MENKLRLTGALNAERFSQLKETAKKDFLVKDATETLNKLVRINDEEDIDIQFSRVYDITASYTLLDYYYNHIGKVEAALTYSRDKGAHLITYKAS